MAEKNGTLVAASTPTTPPQTAPSSRIDSILQALRISLSPISKDPYPPGNDDQTPETGVLEDIKRLGLKDYRTLLLFLDTSVAGVDDDNNMLLERLIQLLAKLPDHSREMKELSQGFINQLWNVLDHPPPSSLGEAYKFREADGSNNNPSLPKFGAANTPYARTVTPLVFQEPNLPDPGEIFDLLLARGKVFEPHPTQISSFMFNLAGLIILDAFQSSSSDPRINLTSSYLDLSPLYGNNADEQSAVRTLKDGLLKPDTFSSTRALGLARGTCVLLVMFNRYHNYVVTQLAQINESGRFTRPAKGASKAAWAKYDNDLFQTGRLITCGLYVNVILKDYVRTILALNRTSSIWSLDPRNAESMSIFGKGAPRGVGNQVSAEFNLVYRWHATLSPRDEKWVSDQLKVYLKGKDPETATIAEVLAALGAYATSVPADPAVRTFGGLKRMPDGTFDDDQLVEELQASIEDLSGSFGPNRIPRCMKAVEMLGILQARAWDVATLNEFRSFVGLTKHATFEDINPDPEVANKLRALYDSPDSVEFYPGLIAEKTKPVVIPGSGLCGNVTTTRAILSDAVALIRGDRFYTVDYSPLTLTNWGYNESNYDVTLDQGHVIHKLIFRAFPKHFVGNSIYAHFPFVIPAENKAILRKLGTANLYSWELPKRQVDAVIVRSYPAVTTMLAEQKRFLVPWGPVIDFLSDKDGEPPYAKDFCLSGDAPANHQSRLNVINELYPKDIDWEADIINFFSATTKRLVKQYSHPIGAFTKTGATDREVDIVRDVITLVTSNFSAAMFSLPIKTEATPDGIFTEQQLAQLLTVVFSAIFFDVDPANSLKLRTTARDLGQKLGAFMEANAKLLDLSHGPMALVTNTARRLVSGVLYGIARAEKKDVDPHDWPVLKNYGDQLVKRMLADGSSVDETVFRSILPLSAAAGTNQTQALCQAVDYYLGDGKAYLADMHELAHENTKEADQKLMKYMLEGMRLRASVAVYRTSATTQKTVDYAPAMPNPADPSGLHPLTNKTPFKTTHSVDVTPGTSILVDLATANRDATAFPDPETVRLDRPLDSYMQFGDGPHWCVGRQMSRVGLAASFKVIMSLKNLRKVDGPRGEQKSFPIVSLWGGQVGEARNPGLDKVGWTGLRMYMTSDQSSYWPVPTTQKVRWSA